MSSCVHSVVKIFLVVCIMFIQNFAHSDSKADKAKQRLEQLFIWKVSDKLQLSPKEEEKWATEYKKLADQKGKLTVKAEELMGKIENSQMADKAKATQLLKEHLAVQSEIHKLQLKEVQIVEKLFGSQKATQYVLVKREMLQKIRDLLSERNHASAN
ncbi:MAG: hypothetical protein IPM57_01645 [Oligoflexia bacterium]|nr:hypothetical protein [Oligoflexia bacterium]